MNAHFNLPKEIHDEVEQLLLASQLQTVAVYAAAEKIRRRWIDKNVALEDLVGLLVQDSGRHSVAISFDPAEARSALLGEGDEQGGERLKN